MIRVRFDPDAPGCLDEGQRAWWDDWLARSETATAASLAAHAEGRDIALVQGVWAELKAWLFIHVFGGRCAYCQGATEPQSYGDAEHWRPKKGVTTVDHQVVERNGTPHGGYFWLAHDWRNLVPACQQCNSGTKQCRGKGTRFPIADTGTYVFAPDEAADLDALDELEQPLLLHPFRGPDPVAHIGFNEFGDPFERDGSSRGKASIAVFNLAREPLRTARQKRQKELRLIVKDAILSSIGGGKPVADTIAEYLEANPEYSSASRDYAWWHFSQTLDRLGMQRNK